MEEFCILVICSCAKEETGFCFELDSLVTLSHYIVLCGCVVVLYSDELFCFNQLSFVLLGGGGGGGGEGLFCCVGWW